MAEGKAGKALSPFVHKNGQQARCFWFAHYLKVVTCGVFHVPSSEFPRLIEKVQVEILFALSY